MQSHRARSRIASPIVVASLALVASVRAQSPNPDYRITTRYGNTAASGGVAGGASSSCGGAIEVTQSTDPHTVYSLFSAACFDSIFGCTAGNEFARSFDLSVGPTAGLMHRVRCVEYGVDELVDTVDGFGDVTIRLYIDTNGGAPNIADMIPLPGGAVTDLVPTATFAELRSVNFLPNNVIVPADATLVAVVESPDLCAQNGPANVYFNGANDLGQSAPSYIRAPSCGATDFTDLATLGYADQHMVLTVELDPVTTERTSVSKKGSVLIFPNVELKWNAAGVLKQDTFLTLVNDNNTDVRVKWYFVNGDEPLDPVFVGPTLAERAHRGWNWVDCITNLTGHESTYLSLASGFGPGGTCSPFTITDANSNPLAQGRPDPNAPPGHRYLRGFAVAFAIDEDGEEICWNHLTGAAEIVAYDIPAAWEYNAYAFQALSTFKEPEPQTCDSPFTCNNGGLHECGTPPPGVRCACMKQGDSSGVCSDLTPDCAELLSCAQGDCPPGYHCIIDSCCDGPVCFPDCPQATELVACASGDRLDDHPGKIKLDGREYDNGYAQLVLDYFAVGSVAMTSGTRGVQADAELTLLPLDIDLRQDSNGPTTTKAEFDVYNSNEDGRSGMTRCITCWDSALMSNYAVTNHFTYSSLQTDFAKTRINGVASPVCDDDCEWRWMCDVRMTAGDTGCGWVWWCEVLSEDSSLVGVVKRILAFSGAVTGTGLAGTTLVGMGTEEGKIRFDIPEGPDTQSDMGTGVRSMDVSPDGLDSIETQRAGDVVRPLRKKQ